MVSARCGACGLPGAGPRPASNEGPRGSRGTRDRLHGRPPRFESPALPLGAWARAAAFGARPNTLLVAGMDGSFLHVVFDPESGAHERTFSGSVWSNEP